MHLVLDSKLKIGVITIGFSNTSLESTEFVKEAASTPPDLLLVDPGRE